MAGDVGQDLDDVQWIVACPRCSLLSHAVSVPLACLSLSPLPRLPLFPPSRGMERQPRRPSSTRTSERRSTWLQSTSTCASSATQPSRSPSSPPTTGSASSSKMWCSRDAPTMTSSASPAASPQSTSELDRTRLWTGLETGRRLYM